jgi:hypothetical protein
MTCLPSTTHGGGGIHPAIELKPYLLKPFEIGSRIIWCGVTPQWRSLFATATWTGTTARPGDAEKVGDCTRLSDVVDALINIARNATPTA